MTGTSTVPASGQTDAEPEHPVWHLVPNPDNDLWIRIRNGYRMPEQYGHPAVQQWVEFYLSHDNHLKASLRRARPFLWHVVQDVSRRNMPLELALLPIVESGYNAAALSYAGAAGLWQFMPPTAGDMNLSKDWWYDGRYDALASTDAALDYLSWLHARFDGNWLLALAAYNAGPSCVDDAMAQARANGQPTDFWHLDLPDETTAYVPKLFALRRLLADPAHYGVGWPSLTDKPRTKEVELPSQIEIDIAAGMLEMAETRLRELNPDVKHWGTDPDRGDAGLLIPVDKVKSFRAALARTDPSRLVKRNWYRVSRGDTLIGIARAHDVRVATLRRANGLQGSRILIGQRLVIPRPGMPVEKPTQPYVVHAGDTLWRIAHRHGITVASLRSVNNLNGSTITPGQTLKLPVTESAVTYQVQQGDSLWTIAQRYDTTPAQLRKWNRLDGNTLHAGQTLAVNGAAPLPDFYNVQEGDTLWDIARKFEVKVATLHSLNDIGSDNTIRPGQRLLLRPSESGT